MNATQLSGQAWCDETRVVMASSRLNADSASITRPPETGSSHAIASSTRMNGVSFSALRAVPKIIQSPTTLDAAILHLDNDAGGIVVGLSDGRIADA